MARDWTGRNAAVFKTIGASNHANGDRQRDDYYATEPKATEWLCKLEKFEGKILEHQPFGWVRIKNSNEYKHVAYIKEKGVFLSDTIHSNEAATYEGTLRWLLFTDDSPFGIKEEI